VPDVQPPTQQPAAAPRRAGLDPATRRPTLLVAAIIAGLFFGSQLVNEAIPASADEGQPGTPLAIGGTATITPIEGWVVTRFEDSSGVRLEKGSVVLDVFEQSSDSAGRLAQAYLDGPLRGQSTELTTTDVATVPSSAGSAARFTYQGLFTGADGAIEGEVTAIVAGGAGVVADAWSKQGRLDGLLGETRTMLESIELGG
jgi:hypothetical protein